MQVRSQGDHTIHLRFCDAIVLSDDFVYSRRSSTLLTEVLHPLIGRCDEPFILNAEIFRLFDGVKVNGKTVVGAGSPTVLLNKEGTSYEPKISTITIEDNGPVRVTLKILGDFRNGSASFANFVVRLSFYARSGIVKVNFTLQNPRAAKHPGGLWDLGDQGSIYFSDLSLGVSINSRLSAKAKWSTQHQIPVTSLESGQLEIYQDSSGGKNWQSQNHVNRDGRVPCQFRGYRAKAGTSQEQGLRCSPITKQNSEHGSVTSTLAEFWQQFPKAVEVDRLRTVWRLFPQQRVHQRVDGGISAYGEPDGQHQSESQAGVPSQ